MSKLIMIASHYWRNSKQRIILLIIVLGSLCLLLANLQNQYLWQDEAQTALVSRTILTEGVPRGYDGKNFFSQEEGLEYGKNYIWRWHTWLPFYILAGFYKVFGVSTLVSRLPFALSGFGTVVLIYFFGKALWPDTRIPIIAAGLLAISVPFLLLSRQCRYYSMVMFFTVLSMYAYAALLNGKKYAIVSLFISSTLLFHSQYFYVPTLFAAMLLHSITFRRDKIKLLLVVSFVVAIVNGPWLVWIAGKYHGYSNLKSDDWFMPIIYITGYLKYIIRYVFPLWLLAVVLITAIIKRVRTGRFFSPGPGFWEKISLPVIFIVFNIISVSFISPFLFFRYISPSIPFLILLVAVIIDAAIGEHWLLAVAAVILLAATSQIKEYLYEITHNYDGPIEGIVLYLNEHASPDDTVAITYEDMPLKFYTKMRIVGGLTGENLKPAQNARWVIIRKYVIREIDAKVRDYLLQNVKWDRYHPITIDYPDIPFENREEPATHLFRTVTNEDRVIIYERND